jgi:tRNA G18 (ribose-2'-O)-methylase SpoU
VQQSITQAANPTLDDWYGEAINESMFSLLCACSGNEGYGVRPVVKRLCTQLVQIEMAQGDVTAPGSGAIEGQRQRLQLVDSLNVSVATGILLHHVMASAKQQ